MGCRETSFPGPRGTPGLALLQLPPPCQSPTDWRMGREVGSMEETPSEGRTSTGRGQHHSWGPACRASGLAGPCRMPRAPSPGTYPVAPGPPRLLVLPWPRSLSITFSFCFPSVSIFSTVVSDPKPASLRSFPGIIQHDLPRPTGLLSRVQRKRQHNPLGPPSFRHFRKQGISGGTGVRTEV
jgi:hypothetical protein